MFTCTSSKGHGLWFVIGGFRSVLFGSLLCDRPVSGNNRPVLKFASQIFLIFLILVTCKNKATSASFPSKKKSTHHRDFLRYSWAGYSHSQPSSASTLHCDFNYPAFTKMIDGTEKPKMPCKFAIRVAQYNEFRCNLFCLCFVFFSTHSASRAVRDSSVENSDLPPWPRFLESKAN